MNSAITSHNPALTEAHSGIMPVIPTRSRLEDGPRFSEAISPMMAPHPLSPKIVVVDDQPGITFSVTAILNQSGFSAVGFVRPEEALLFCMTSPVDLLLSDYDMPNMDGISLIRRVNAIQPRCLFFLLSAVAGDEHVVADIEATGLAIFTASKPLAPRCLMDAIRMLLSVKQGAMCASTDVPHEQDAYA